MTVSEKIELLGKGVYKDIPSELTLKAIPTVSELDYVGAEDFDATMLDKILPKAVDEQIDFRHLLEIDYQWLCRCLRILNYGPYHTVNTIYCSHCGQASYGEFQVDVRSIECKTLPEGFVNDIEIPADALIDFQKPIHIKLPTIQDINNAYKDKAFQDGTGKVNVDLARICYMIVSLGNYKNLTPVEYKLKIQKELSPADYIVLKTEINRLADYGLRAGGSTTCPKCHSNEASFLALADDRFFRPTLDNLREWKRNRSSGTDEDTSRNTSNDV